MRWTARQQRSRLTFAPSVPHAGGPGLAADGSGSPPSRSWVPFVDTASSHSGHTSHAFGSAVDDDARELWRTLGCPEDAADVR
jgi:hypothetical protein